MKFFFLRKKVSINCFFECFLAADLNHVAPIDLFYNQLQFP